MPIMQEYNVCHTDADEFSDPPCTSFNATVCCLQGMGEPLHNLDAVLPALEILTHPQGLSLSPNKVNFCTHPYSATRHKACAIAAVCLSGTTLVAPHDASGKALTDTNSALRRSLSARSGSCRSCARWLPVQACSWP